jgi:hypothetical protein
MKIKCDSYNKSKCYECIYLDHVDEKGFSSYPETDWEQCVGMWKHSITKNSFTWHCTRDIQATWTRYNLEITMKEVIKKYEEDEKMQKGQVEHAVRKAHEVFDRWNKVTGMIPIYSGYYYEMLSIIDDAVHIGIQMALNGEVNMKKEEDLDGCGEVVKTLKMKGGE